MDSVKSYRRDPQATVLFRTEVLKGLRCRVLPVPGTGPSMATTLNDGLDLLERSSRADESVFTLDFSNPSATGFSAVRRRAAAFGCSTGEFRRRPQAFAGAHTRPCGPGHGAKAPFGIRDTFQGTWKVYGGFLIRHSPGGGIKPVGTCKTGGLKPAGLIKPGTDGNVFRFWEG